MEKARAVTAQRKMCLRKRKVYWNEKERNELQHVVGLLKVYAGKMKSTMNLGAVVAYLMLAVLINFSVELMWNLVWNRDTVVVFLPVESEMNSSKVQRIRERECSGIGTISVSSKLILLETFIAQASVSKSSEEKMKLVHLGYNQFWMTFAAGTMRDLR